ncbi:MAG: hypothetical protein M0R80_18730 [Proteobacteria bacterium]|nr:hypothetical protein [Pseudomonadota bacterium]
MTARTESTCPRCGAAVDPLRAGAVSIVGGRIIHFCSPECRSIHLNRPDPSEPAIAVEPPAVASEEHRPEPGAEAPPQLEGEPFAPTIAEDLLAPRRGPLNLLASHLAPLAIEAAVLCGLAAAAALVPPALRGLLAAGIAAVGVVASAVLGVLRARRQGLYRVAESIAPHVAAALLLTASVAGSGSRYPLLCALAVLIAERVGRAVEIVGRRRSGVLEVAAGARLGLVADEWRDNSSTAALLRRAALVLGWARFPFAAALALALRAAGLLSAEDALAAGAVALIALNTRALRLATGDVHLAVALAASRNGIAVRDANAVERIGASRIAMFMARRTLLAKELRVVDWRVVPGLDASSVAAHLAALESKIAGRFAEPIASFASGRASQPLPSVDRAELIPGAGAVGAAAGGEVLCGTRRLLLDRCVSTAEHEPWASEVEASGRRAFFVGMGGRVAATFAIEEEPLPVAGEVVRSLALQGLEPAMASSAEVDAARALGARLGIERVHFEVSEARIGSVLTDVASAGDTAILLGHGPAFEEALRTATAAIALGGTGPTLADADMGDRGLDAVPAVIAAARSARASIRWNVIGLSAALGAGVGLSATWPTPGAAVVAAAIGAAAGAACTVNRPYPLLGRWARAIARRLDRISRALGAKRR